MFVTHVYQKYQMKYLINKYSILQIHFISTFAHMGHYSDLGSTYKEMLYII